MKPAHDLSPHQTRRHFISNTCKAAAAGVLLSSPLAALAQTKTWTVGEIMDLFIKEVPGSPFPNTVDTLKAGSRDQPVTGIVTTMFATIPVIQQAIALGANFIIAHEPTFYNHADKTNWLQSDATYHYKWQLLNDHKIAVWRNHDYIHAHKPDGVYSGLLDQLGWKPYVLESSPQNVELPAATALSELIRTLKDRLGIKTLRYIGDETQVCRKILLMPGAYGGERQISAISQYQPDVAIVGEVQEWETPEYVRDARAAGKNLSLIVLGHVNSEDAGSIYLKDWLNKKAPSVKVTHIPSGNPFSFA